MVKVMKGQLVVTGKRFGIVGARFNELITEKLIDGAVDTFLRHGAKEGEIEVVWVPGSFEIPYVAQKMVKNRKYDAVICLGAVIRGATPHFEYIASEVAKGIARVSLDAGVPVIFGIITADNLEQALERAGVKLGNKGRDAALSAIEMVNLFEVLEFQINSNTD